LAGELTVWIIITDINEEQFKTVEKQLAAAFRGLI
jgi:hypothetical protein